MIRIVECVPNFSEGRNPETVRAIETAIAACAGVEVLRSEMDPDHHRSVITFVGTPEGVLEAAFRACETASRRIDLRTHRGVHPRIGATDVIPLVPLRNVDAAACVALACRLGERIARSLAIPVYLYGQAALKPERRELAAIRKGGFERLQEAMDRDTARQPDIGPRQVHPTAGAVAVGVRDILIAYNVYLASADVHIARAIARSLRERDGGLPGVRALGLFLPAQNRTQVSMNLTDYRNTPLGTVMERIRAAARMHGVDVAESELIGLAPLAFALQAADACPGFSVPPDRILEYRIDQAIKTGVFAPEPGSHA
jgi:glutamate formiminotransferase